MLCAQRSLSMRKHCVNSLGKSLFCRRFLFVLMVVTRCPHCVSECSICLEHGTKSNGISESWPPYVKQLGQEILGGHWSPSVLHGDSCKLWMLRRSNLD
jgi:hypothetical protein